MRRLILGMTMVLAFCSCHQRTLIFSDEWSSYEVNMEFTYDLVWHEDYTSYDQYDHVGLNWTESSIQSEMGELVRSAIPGIPEGIRIQILKENEFYQTTNLSADGGTLHLPEGAYSMLFYNNDTEAIVINQEYSTTRVATATTRTRVRTSYIGNPLMEGTRAEETVTEPDNLFFAYIPALVSNKENDGQRVQVGLKPVVFSYLVRFNFTHGYEYVALARGTLEGMAASVNLNDGSTTDNTATILYDCSLENGYVTASVKSFGIPGYKLNAGVLDDNGSIKEESGKYGITLELRLNNGNYLTYNFDVTDQVALQPNGGVITVDNIAVSDEEGKSGGSAFDVTVDNWGDYEDIILPF